MAPGRPWAVVVAFALCASSCASMHGAPPGVFDPFGEAALFEGDETPDARWPFALFRRREPDAAHHALADRAERLGLCTRAAALNAASPLLRASTRERDLRALRVLCEQRPGLVDSTRAALRALVVPPLVREGLIEPGEADRILRPLNLFVSPVQLAACASADPPPFKALAGQLLLMAEAETLLVRRRCGPGDPELDAMVAAWKGLPTFEQRFRVAVALGALPQPLAGDLDLARRAKCALARTQFRRALADARRTDVD